MRPVHTPRPPMQPDGNPLPLPAAASTPTIALQAENISKAFFSGKQRTQVLDSLSLHVNAAELTLISGPSGCG